MKICEKCPSSEKWKVHEIEQNSGIIPSIGVTLWLGGFGILLWTSVYLFFFGSRLEYSVTVGLVSLSLMLPKDFPMRWGYNPGDWIVLQGEKYFGLKTTFEDEQSLIALASKGKPAIFSLEPHGVFTFPAVAFHPALKRIPGHNQTKCCVLVSSMLFRMPFIRQIFYWTEARPADKLSFLGALEENKSIVIIPGGVQEVALMDPMKPDQLKLYLKKRKGFVKLALKTGTPIIPAFAFHQDDCFGFWLPRGRLPTQFARFVGFMPVFFWGRFGIPLGIPRPRKIHVVVGQTINIPCEGEKVSAETVDKFHALFLKELEALFERHKENDGYGDRKLDIL